MKKAPLLNVVPGVGVGRLMLGMSPEQVRRVMGEPSFAEREGDDDLTMSYEDPPVDLVFERNRLAIIDCLADPVFLFENDPIEGDEEEVLSLFEGRLAFGEPHGGVDDGSEEYHYHAKDSTLTLFFNSYDNQLNGFSIGPKVDENDKTIWPTEIS